MVAIVSLLGITTKEGYPHMLHALFIKKLKPPSTVISEATQSEPDTPLSEGITT